MTEADQARPQRRFHSRPTTPIDLVRREAFFDSHVFIHTHLEKAGGTSLTYRLADLVGWMSTVDTRRPVDRMAEQMPPEWRRTVRLYSGHFHYGQHVHFEQTPLYLATVREPLSRAVSYYRYIVANPTHPGYPKIGSMSFESAVDYWIDGGHSILNNGQARAITGNRDDEEPTEEEVLRQSAEVYFLVAPMRRIPTAITAMRRALGVQNFMQPALNVGSGDKIKLKRALRARMEQRLSLDAALFAATRTQFPEQLERACDLLRDATHAEAGADAAPPPTLETTGA